MHYCISSHQIRVQYSLSVYCKLNESILNKNRSGIEYEYFALGILPISREILKSAYQHIFLYYTFKNTVELLHVPSRNTFLMSDNYNITVEILCLWTYVLFFQRRKTPYTSAYDSVCFSPKLKVGGYFLGLEYFVWKCTLQLVNRIPKSTLPPHPSNIGSTNTTFLYPSLLLFGPLKARAEF